MQPAWFLTLEQLPVRQPYANHFRLAEMAEAPGRAGLATRIIAPRGGGRARRVTLLEGAEHGVYPCGPIFPAVVCGRRSAGLITLALGRSWLYRQALREHPAWIFVHDSLYAPAVRSIKRRLGRRVGVHVDVMGLSSLEVQYGPAGSARLRLGQRLYRHLERLLFEAADLITVVNDSHATMVARLYAPRAPVVVLRDAAEPGGVGPLPRPDLAAAGVPPAPHRLVFVGQIMRSRLDGLFRALERIPRTLGVQALIVGDGPDRGAYEHQVASSPSLRGRVFFVGYQERSRALALAATCTLAFSDCWSTAGFPGKLFEYMALGRVIIVQGKEQIREVLQDGRDALFYRTVDEVAIAITRLCEDASLRQRLGSAALASFEAAHTWRHRRAQLDALIAPHLTPPSALRGAAGSRRGR